jgi:hypothetical protein
MKWLAKYLNAILLTSSCVVIYYILSFRHVVAFLVGWVLQDIIRLVWQACAK